MDTATSGPITADDVDAVVRRAVDALGGVVEQDWHVPAGSLDWDCWETLEHVADDLFAYAGQLVPVPAPTTGDVPFEIRQQRAGGPHSTIFARAEDGNAGLIQVLETCGGFLTAVVRTARPETRAHHIFGVVDPSGFAAMGVIEVLVHLHDLAGGLGFEWEPDSALSNRVRVRLFPDAPTDTDAWQTLLWAIGRTELPDRERLTKWRWYAEPVIHHVND
ncbi:MAG: hypothetical protein ACR2KJ_00820 [Jatrophihabitans sp.]